MSVLIKNMDSPKACVYRENGHLIFCPLYDMDGYCGALNKEASHKEGSILSDCPIVPVVRCKDCKWFRLYEKDSEPFCGYWDGYNTDANGFCYMGEKVKE